MWDAKAEADRWRRQAANDLAFARVALRERFYAQACFIAQQASEKAVKAMAYGLGEPTVLGRSLVTLISRYADPVSELDDLRELAGILDQYYVPTRYPNGLAGACRSRRSARRRRRPRSRRPTASCSSQSAMRSPDSHTPRRLQLRGDP